MPQLGISSDNKYAGGITFSPPAFQLGAANGTQINGGFTFDLPLATVASFTNRALDFSANNSAINRGFLGGVINTAQQQVNTANNSALEYLNSANQTLVGINSNNQVMATWRSFFSSTQKTAGGGGGGCFITTAVCRDAGLPDNCESLTLLRKFRDEYMVTNFARNAWVKEYYRIAPAIVAALDSLTDKGAYYYEILRREYIAPAIGCIKAGNNNAAMFLYKKMVERAAKMAEV